MYATIEPTADQIITGTTADGETFTVARYGAQVVVNIDGESHDFQYATEAEAAAEAAGFAAAL